MNEFAEIARLWREAQGNAAILASIVRVQGSAYRRPGARMLMLSDGRRAGSVSGGCLENDLFERAWKITGQHRAVIHTYNTMPGEDNVFGLSMGCQGIIDILLERLDA